ncbi:MAG: hypothetical protein JSV76_05235 [Candidatus Bathyarchaeota archaeon]|nr:MAG: hypothetical protein JSV76_05235 [Candidatus Bathyarchaeota archaeon]
MPPRSKVELEIEKGLTGAGKLKILRLLMKRPHHAFTRYEIGKKVTNDPISIRNDLATLVEINWVIEYQIQHLKKYSVNSRHPTVTLLADFLRKARYLL